MLTEKRKAYERDYKSRNAERIATQDRDRRKANPERFAEKTRVWRSRNPEREKFTQWKTDLKRNYGLSPEDFSALLANQDGMCSICRTELVLGKHTHVDHDHTSDVVRGILCHHCNLLLGNARDNVEILKAAIAYLQCAENRGENAKFG